MKDSVLTKIATTPLSFPYFDVEALRAIEPMDARFKVALFEVNDAVNKEYGFDLERVPEITLAQYQAGKYVAEKFDRLGMSQIRAAELSGIAKSMLSKYLKGKRPFAPGANLAAPFCYNVLAESCNKVMLGYDEIITLPSVYAETVRALASLDDDKKKELLRKAKVQMALYEQRNPTEIKNAPHRDLSQMIGERIFELIYDQGTHGYLLFGQDTPYGVRNFLRQFIVEDFKRESPRMGHLMYLAFETHMALDYFIAEDFTKFCKCYYKDGDQLIEVTDKEILQYIGICSSVPAEQKSRLMGDAIGASLAQSFTK